VPLTVALASTGAVVSTTTESADEDDETLPDTSVTVAVTLCEPWASELDVVMST
jgi:hypothetical protein